MSSIKAKISCDPIIRRNPILQYEREREAKERRLVCWSFVFGGALGILVCLALVGLVSLIKLKFK